MAKISKENSLMEFPLQIKRQYAAPIDTTSVFYSLETAQTYATSGATSYVGQVITVVDEANQSAKAYVIADTAGTLQEVGSGSAQPMQFVANEAAMLALTDIEAGQQVYREDTHTVWIFKGGDPASLSQWAESASASDTIWHGTQNKVIFYAATKTQYDALDTKDANTLYFITDSGKIFKGDTDLTKSVARVTAFPEATAAIPNVLYVNAAPAGENSGCELRVSDGTQWTVINPGYYTDGGNWAAADSTKFATIGLIKKGIQAAIEGISLATVFTVETGTVKVGSGEGAVLTGVAHGATYDASTLTLTIPQYGQDDLVVNIPKDKFVKSGAYYEDWPTDAPTQHKVIVLEVEQGDPVVIPAASLVDVYTADNEGKNVQVTISDDNKVSAMITLDPDANNALKYTAGKGFIVNISGKMDKIADATGGKLVVSAADGSVAESTASIADFVSKVVGVENNLVAFGANGAIKDSAKKVGGEKLSDTPAADTVATEAAVADAFSWSTM